MNKLRRDVQEISNRKIEILKRVFSEVDRTYNEYLERVQGINHYLTNKNHTITGGNRASLKSKKAPGYPVKWMRPFRHRLDEVVNNKIGLFQQLEKEVDINKIMMKAFKMEGGGENATPEDLLNPKSYFDLDFELKFDSGDINVGSQGQTYTANALLGLARLSLLEREGKKGLKIMPIDEAEGLGSNYDMLHRLAVKENYQIVSMSIETAGEILENEQFIFMMNERNSIDGTSYIPPLGIFFDENITEDIDGFFMNQYQKNG